jgi:hypothetical protein
MLRSHFRRALLADYLPGGSQNPITLVPITAGWGALVHSKYVDEISRAPDDIISFIEAASEVSVYGRYIAYG